MHYENTHKIYNTPDNLNFSFVSTPMDFDVAFPNHCHKDLEILRVMSGSLGVLCNQRTYRLGPGEVLVISPYSNHACLKPGRGTCLRQVVMFDTELIHAFFHHVDPEENMPYRDLLGRISVYSGEWSQPGREAVLAILDRMHREFARKDYGWKIAIKIMICELFLTFLRLLPHRQEAKGEAVSKVQAALEYIAANFDKNITLRQCAALLGFNPSYFSRFFREHIGMPFQEYVKTSKIEKAKFLLVSTDAPVQEVSFQSGYADVGTFHRAFKTVVGDSPLAFRKKHAIRP
jgi:AraC-like DNA-binding protein/quercetin dioxygenase-like cupin family protein